MGTRNLFILVTLLRLSRSSPLLGSEQQPPPPPAQYAGLTPPPVIADCTTTLFVTPSQLCHLDPTKTVYDSTATSYASVNCNGCQSVVVSKPVVPCPTIPAVTTTTASTASTAWSTVCQASDPAYPTSGGGGGHPPPPAVPEPTLPQPTDPPARRADNAAEAACTTTLTVIPTQVAGLIKTVYQSTTTETVNVPCGSGCSLLVSTLVQGYGPPPLYTSTFTAPRATATAYKCA